MKDRGIFRANGTEFFQRLADREILAIDTRVSRAFGLLLSEGITEATAADIADKANEGVDQAQWWNRLPSSTVRSALERFREKGVVAVHMVQNVRRTKYGPEKVESFKFGGPQGNNQRT